MENNYDLKFKDSNFNLKYTLECGQCFRWKCAYSDDLNITYEYAGVIEDRVIRIRQEKNIFYVSSNNTKNLKQKVNEYFDLNNVYKNVEKDIGKIDSNIQTSLRYSSGLHILNQPVFETLISYIISANNNIKRISKSVEKISEVFGKKVIFENNEYHLFPTIEELEKASDEDLLACGVGFRSRYILKTVKMIKEDNDILKNHSSMSNENLKKELIGYFGIGNKVADCIMLFSMKRRDVFPIDVWVKRVMEKLYFKKNVSMKEIEKYAKENFGANAGLIQQHLFYNIREENI